MAVGPEAVGIAYAGIGVLSLGFLRPAYRYRDKPGSTGFAVIVAAISLWSVGAGIIYGVDWAISSIVAYSMRLFAAQLVAIGSVLLAVEFTTPGALSRRLVAPLVGYLVVVQALVWTNAAHELVFSVADVSRGTVLAVEYGPVFWGHLVVAYALVVLAIGLLFAEFLSTTGARRRQSFTLAIALLIPFFLNVASNFGANPTPYDLTPIGFLVSEVTYTWALYGTGFLSVVPVARRTAIEAMDDAYVTLDRENVVVDFNDAAGAIFDLDGDAAIGTRVEDAFAGFPALVSYLTTETETQTELAIARGDETYHFHVTVTPLRDAASYAGRVLVMRDITSLKRREKELKRRESELDLLRQVFTRVLRHDLRNSLCIVKGHGETIAREADEPLDDSGAAIVAEGDRLEDIAQKTTTIARLVNEREIVTCDLVACVHEVTASLDDRYPAASIELTTPPTAPIRASTGLEAALRNLVENAVEHGSTNPGSQTRQDAVEHGSTSPASSAQRDALERAGDEPTVRVSVRRNGSETILEVSDDGPGIPPQEIEVLEGGRETALEHGSGVGLWLVDWVVTHSDGELSFETSDEGTTVTVRFRSADADTDAGEP